MSNSISNPTIRVELQVSWDAGTDSADDDRQIRVEVEYPNDSKAQLPDVVARRLADFVGALALPEGTGPQPGAKVPNVTVEGSATDAEIADAIRRRGVRYGAAQNGAGQ